MANSILEAVSMNGGMSFAIHKIPKKNNRMFADPRPIPLALRPATVVVHSFTGGKPAALRQDVGVLVLHP
jgi:hypothetical protein